MSSTASNNFLSIENFDKLLKVFSNYMANEYNVSIPTDSETTDKLRKMLFSVMQRVRNDAKASNQPLTLRSFNHQCISDLRDLYMEDNNLASTLVNQNNGIGGTMNTTKKPVLQTLNRDTDIYGNRSVVMNELTPQNTNISSISKNEVAQKYEFIVSQRNPQGAAADAVNLPFTVTKEDPIPQDTITARMKDFEDDRLLTSISIKNAQTDLSTQDPKALFSTNTTMSSFGKSQDDAQLHIRAQEQAFTNTTAQTIIPTGSVQREVTKYLMLNGYDRKWESHPNRYSFILDTDDLNQTIRNITEIQITKLIIPLEASNKRNTSSAVQDNQSTTDSLARPTNYYRYGLTFPYLLLHISEIPNMYSGLNQAIQRATTTFIFDKAYTTDNGRGFMILMPVQEETKVFYPNKMATLPKLTLSIMRPNGMLYNMSSDDNAIEAAAYNPLDANKLYLRLFTSKYFEKNDINVGDVIIIKGFKLPTPEEFSSRLQQQTGQVPTQQELVVYKNGISQVEDFMNRSEGHEVQALGAASSSTALIKDFAIFIPRILNTVSGAYEVDVDFARTLGTYLGHTSTTTNTYFSQIALSQDAPLLNTTLQVSMSFTIKTVSADVSSGLQSSLT